MSTFHISLIVFTLHNSFPEHLKVKPNAKQLTHFLVVLKKVLKTVLMILTGR